ncbi:MAG: GNAT family protein [Pseudomonadota bacterium]
MLTGVTTALRAIEPEDLEHLRAWRNRPEFRRFFRETEEISSVKQRKWYDAVVLADPRVIMFAIEEKGTGRLLGACGLCYIDRVNASADFSIYIGADNLYIDEKFAPDAARILLRYGFDEQNLHRIWAEIYDFDASKQKLFAELGFALDGRHRETHWTEGAWCDSLFYGLLAKDFRI